MKQVCKGGGISAQHLFCAANRPHCWVRQFVPFHKSWTDLNTQLSHLSSFILYVSHICHENCKISDHICMEINQTCNSCHPADQIKALKPKSSLVSSAPLGIYDFVCRPESQKLSIWQSRKQVLLHKNNYLPIPRVTHWVFQLTLTINLTQDVSSWASKSHNMFTGINAIELTQLHFLPIITQKHKMPSSLILCMPHDGCSSFWRLKSCSSIT